MSKLPTLGQFMYSRFLVVGIVIVIVVVVIVVVNIGAV